MQRIKSCWRRLYHPEKLTSRALTLCALVSGPNADSVPFKLPGTNEGRFFGRRGRRGVPDIAFGCVPTLSRARRTALVRSRLARDRDLRFVEHFFASASATTAPTFALIASQRPATAGRARANNQQARRSNLPGANSIFKTACGSDVRSQNSSSFRQVLGLCPGFVVPA